MKKRTLTFTSLYLVLAFFSCKKNDDATYVDKGNEEPFIYNLDPNTKPYQILSGSYWIFENDSTGFTDSIVVISIEHDFFWSQPPLHSSNGAKDEFYKINLKNFTTSETYYDFIVRSCIKRYKEDGGGEYEVFGEYGQPVLLINSTAGSIFGTMQIISKIPTLTINSNTFNNVTEVKITASLNSAPIFPYDTYLYYSDSIGIIKKVVDFGNSNLGSWSIKRWNVIK